MERSAWATLPSLQMNFQVKFISRYKLKLAHTCRIRSSKVLLFKIRAKLLCEEFYKC